MAANIKKTSLQKTLPFLLVLLIAFLILLSCGERKPTQIESQGTLFVQIIDDQQLPVAEAQVRWTSDLGIRGEIQLTDSSGNTVFTEMASGEYTIAATKRIDENISYIGSEKKFIESGQIDSVTVPVRLNSAGLKINEIYYAGPVSKKGYIYDQFIELYNGGQDTAYLDGTIFIRGGASALAGRDNDNDGDLDYYYFNPYDGKEYLGFLYAFQLDGDPITGRKYPLAPGEYAVVAVDAINHKELIPTSVDLSHAQYEFYNPYDFRDPNDPNIPNYVNIITGEHGPATHGDFMINLYSGVILLASGEDSEYWDGIDLDTIIDGVEYSNSKTAHHKLDDRIDKGSAGVEADKVVTSYSGMSIQRIRPGFDTNNSTVDFMILDSPTPGY